MRNRFLCLTCGEIVESEHRHDWQSCSCGNYTDGGKDYIHCGGDMDAMLYLTGDEPCEPEAVLPEWLGNAIKSLKKDLREALDRQQAPVRAELLKTQSDHAEQARLQRYDVERRWKP